MPRGWTFLLALGLTLSAATAAAQEPLEIVLEIRLRGGESRTVLALARDSAVLVPITTVLDLAGVGIDSVAAGARVIATLQPDGTPLRLDGLRRQGSGVGGTVALQPDSGLWVGGEYYVATSVLDVVLGVESIMDWSMLILTIQQTDHLPVVQFAARTRRRERMLEQRRRERRTPLPFHGPRPSVLDGVVLDWSYATPTGNPFRQSTIRTALGASVLRGGLLVDHTEALSPGSRITTTRASWQRVWPNQPLVRQVLLGDGSVGELRSQLVRGAVVSNAPYLRSNAFGTRQVHGQLEPGWEVELYRADDLLDFQTTGDGGRYAFDVPVTYGPNPLQVVAYSPHGRVERRTLEILVPRTRLPTGQLEYTVGGGTCQIDPCVASGAAGARYAATSNVTLGAGVEAFWRDSLQDLQHPYISVSASPTAGTSLEFTAALHAYARANLTLTPNSDLRWSVRLSRYDASIPIPLVQPREGRFGVESALFWRPRVLPGETFLTGTVNSLWTVGGAQHAFSGSTVSRVLDTRVALTARVLAFRGAVTITQTLLGVRLDRAIARRGAWAGSFARLEVLTDAAEGLEQVLIGASKPVLGRLRVDLDAGWDRQRGALVTLKLATHLPFAQATSITTVSADAGTGGVNLLEGSVVWGASSGSLRTTSGRAASYGGLTGVVFLDGNQNGRRDDGENGLENVLLAVGQRTVRSDSTGRYAAWDLVPFEETVVEVDSLSFANPMWIPTLGYGTIRVQPNAYRRLDIPVIPGGEIVGTVTWEAGREAPGMYVVLEDANGLEVRRQLTFSDGSFYFLGVRPGSYHVRVLSEQQERMAVQSDPVALEIPARAGGASLEAHLILRRP